jgi:uncharacterized membrane protein YhdT
MANSAAVVAAVLVVLFVAPLVLGTYVMAQGRSRLGLMAWFGAVTVLLLIVLVGGVVALITIPG